MIDRCDLVIESADAATITALDAQLRTALAPHASILRSVGVGDAAPARHRLTVRLAGPLDPAFGDDLTTLLSAALWRLRIRRDETPTGGAA